MGVDTGKVVGVHRQACWQDENDPTSVLGFTVLRGHYPELIFEIPRKMGPALEPTGEGHLGNVSVAAGQKFRGPAQALAAYNKGGRPDRQGLEFPVQLGSAQADFPGCFPPATSGPIQALN